MKILSLAATAWMAMTWSCSAAWAAPRMVCPDPEFKFGTVETGLEVQATFHLQNAGDEPLVISKVLPACGCTTAKLSENTIAPGKEAILSAGLSLKLRKGELKKEIVLDSNDPKNPHTVVSITGKAVYPFNVTPEKLFLGAVDAHQGPSRTIELAVPSTATEANGELHIKGVEVGDPQLLTAKLEEVQKGKTYRIAVTLGKQLALGDLRSFVRVRTDHPQVPVFSIPVTATVTGELAMAPTTLQVLDPRDKAGVTQYIVIRPATVKAFKIREVVSPSKKVETKLIPMGDNVYRIRVSNLTPTPDLDRKLITIKTDVPGLADLRIPIRLVNQAHLPASPTGPVTPEDEPAETTTRP